MSYARKGPDSDVHVYTDGERWHCIGCALGMGVPTMQLRPGTEDNPPVELEWSCPSAGQMLAHLEAHVLAGQRVPQAAIERLRSEAST